MTDKLNGKHILLVEDNAMNILVAGKFLKKWNVHYDQAVNGLEAVEKASSNSYDVILMDLQMPEMDGYEATRIIRQSDQRTPIIALTASALPQDQELVYAAGMNDFILKPFSPDDLMEKLARNIATGV